MKLRTLIAATGLSLAFSGSALADQPVALSDAQLDAVVAGTYENGGYDKPRRHDRKKGDKWVCNCGGSGILPILNGSLNGNEVNVLSGNNVAVGVGILGTGAIAVQHSK